MRATLQTSCLVLCVILVAGCGLSLNGGTGGSDGTDSAGGAGGVGGAGGASAGGTGGSGSGQLCTDTCLYNHDNYCDDGGDMSLTGNCAFGTDCADCGVRTQP